MSKTLGTRVGALPKKRRDDDIDKLYSASCVDVHNLGIDFKNQLVIQTNRNEKHNDPRFILDVWIEIFEYCSAGSIFALAETNRFLYNVAEVVRKQHILSRRITSMVEYEFGHGDEFWIAMKSSNALLSGSVILSAINGDEIWKANDIDIYRKPHHPEKHDRCSGNMGEPFTAIESYLYPLKTFYQQNENYNNMLSYMVRTYTILMVNCRKNYYHRISINRESSHYYETKADYMPSIQTIESTTSDDDDGSLEETGPRSHSVQVLELKSSYTQTDRKKRVIDETLNQHIERVYDFCFLRSTYDGKSLNIMRKRSIMLRTSDYDARHNFNDPYNEARLDKYTARGFTIRMPGLNDRTWKEISSGSLN